MPGGGKARRRCRVRHFVLQNNLMTRVGRRFIIGISSLVLRLIDGNDGNRVHAGDNIAELIAVSGTDDGFIVRHFQKRTLFGRILHRNLCPSLRQPGVFMSGDAKEQSRTLPGQVVDV